MFTDQLVIYLVPMTIILMMTKFTIIIIDAKIAEINTYHLFSYYLRLNLLLGMKIADIVHQV